MLRRRRHLSQSPSAGLDTPRVLTLRSENLLAGKRGEAQSSRDIVSSEPPFKRISRHGSDCGAGLVSTAGVAEELLPLAVLDSHSRTVTGLSFMQKQPNDPNVLSLVSCGQDHLVVTNMLTVHDFGFTHVENQKIRQSSMVSALTSYCKVPSSSSLFLAHSSGQLVSADSEAATTQLLGDGHFGCVTSVATTLNGCLIATAGSDNTVRLTSRAGRTLCVLRRHTQVVTSVAFSPDGCLASGSLDGTVCLYDCTAALHAAEAPLLPLSSRQATVAVPLLQCWRNGFGEVHALTFGKSAQRAELAVACTSGLWIWSAEFDDSVGMGHNYDGLSSDRERGRWLLQHHCSLAVAFSPDNRLLAIAVYGPTEGGASVLLLDIASGQVAAAVEGLQPKQQDNTVMCTTPLVFDLSGRFLAFSLVSSLVRVLDTRPLLLYLNQQQQSSSQQHQQQLDSPSKCRVLSTSPFISSRIRAMLSPRARRRVTVSAIDTTNVAMLLRTNSAPFNMDAQHTWTLTSGTLSSHSNGTIGNDGSMHDNDGLDRFLHAWMQSHSQCNFGVSNSISTRALTTTSVSPGVMIPGCSPHASLQQQQQQQQGGGQPSNAGAQLAKTTRPSLATWSEMMLPTENRSQQLRALIRAYNSNPPPETTIPASPFQPAAAGRPNETYSHCVGLTTHEDAACPHSLMRPPTFNQQYPRLSVQQARTASPSSPTTAASMAAAAASTAAMKGTGASIHADAKATATTLLSCRRRSTEDGGRGLDSLFDIVSTNLSAATAALTRPALCVSGAYSTASHKAKQLPLTAAAAQPVSVAKMLGLSHLRRKSQAERKEHMRAALTATAADTAAAASTLASTGLPLSQRNQRNHGYETSRNRDYVRKSDEGDVSSISGLSWSGGAAMHTSASKSAHGMDELFGNEFGDAFHFITAIRD